VDKLKRGGGRPRSTALVYAIELGIPHKRLLMLGGEARLRAMSDDARAILLKPGPQGNSRTVHKGGLAGRGYKKFVRGVVSQAERVA
jgi:hypothetical protein